MTVKTHPKGPGHRDREITLSGLRTFVAVAEARNFAFAAEAPGVSQPTVSVQLAALEEGCGVLLLYRRPHLELTEAGSKLFVRARLAVGRVEEFALSTKDLLQMQRGSLLVGMSTPHSALPIIAAMMKTYPAVTVTTTMGNIAELLASVVRVRQHLLRLRSCSGPRQPRRRAHRAGRTLADDHALEPRAGCPPAESGNQDMMRLPQIVPALACAVGVLATASPAAADLRSACMRDYVRFCTGVAPGDGRVARCLQANRANLSSSCADAFSAIASCRPEIERHCRGVQEPSEIKACLRRNDASISDSCRRNMARF